jgi:hypothetical protein
MKGMRKLYACAIVFLIGTIAMFIHFIDGGLWVKMALGVLTLFVTGNVASKFSPPSPPDR